MILFHAETLDFDDPDMRLRAWLPARLLRRSGLPARLAAGDVPGDLLRKATVVILTGGNAGHARNLAERAAGAGIPVILDIGSVAILNALTADTQRQEFIAIATIASRVTAGNDLLARRVKRISGIAHVSVVPDPVDLGDAFPAVLFRHPGAAVRAAAKWGDRLARDVAARLRRRWPGHELRGRGCKRVVWFGAARTPNAEGGVAELLLAASDLADLTQEGLVRLDIVGRSPRAARRLLKQLAIPIAFYRYSPGRVRQRLRGADLCLLPYGGDEESLARSSVRARLASALGVPVVAGPTTASMLPAMRSALSGGATAPRLSARELERDRDEHSVAMAWRQVIDAARPTRARELAESGAVAVRPDQRLRLLLLLQQFQDIDLIVPVAEAASAAPDIEVRVAVLSKIVVSASRRLRAICSNGAKVEFWHGADLLGNAIEPARFAVDVAVTASEGPGIGARFARAFVAASQAAGARVLSLQHGLDNGGLTYGPRVPPSSFRGDLILTWGGMNRLCAAASAEVRQRTVPVGCPKRAFARSDFPGFPLADRPFIAIFENLHWRRYNDVYRAQFVADLAAVAEALPDQTLLVKPHMGGQWFVRGGAAEKPLPSNIVIADPKSALWRRFTADAFLAHASAVITTPSTVALDAARYGLPVALVTYGIPAENYVPLPRLETGRDWLDFLDRIRRGEHDRKRLDAFFADAAIPGDAVARILTVVRMAGARQSHGEILSALSEAPHRLVAS
jgi:hypothetical protein